MYYRKKERKKERKKPVALKDSIRNMVQWGEAPTILCTAPPTFYSSGPTIIKGQRYIIVGWGTILWRSGAKEIASTALYYKGGRFTPYFK